MAADGIRSVLERGQQLFNLPGGSAYLSIRLAVTPIACVFGEQDASQ